MSTGFYAELRGAFYTSQRTPYMDSTAVCPPVAYYQRLNPLSDFHEISCKSSLQNVVKPNFHENRLSDRRNLTLWMTSRCVFNTQQSVTSLSNITVYFILLYVSYMFRSL